MTLHRDSSVEPSDHERFEPGFGSGGVPILLVLLYLSFLTFFVWYSLEYQLPDFLKRGPGATENAQERAAEGGGTSR